MKKIIIFVNDYDYFISHKYDVFKKFNKKKYLFEIYSPYKKNYRKSNFYFRTFFINSLSINIFKEILTFFHMLFIIIKNQDQIFHYYTIKPILYGSILSKIFFVKKNLFIFSGLGNIILGKKNFFIKKILFYILKITLSSSDHKFIFQNKFDFNFLKKSQIIKSKNIFFTLGSGLNLKNMPKIKNKNKKTINIVMPCRMKHHKGVTDFIEIAKYFKNSKKNIDFFLAGKTKNSNDYLKYSFLKKLNKMKNNLKWLGEIKKNKVYELADIILILSYYGEGIPRVILESTYYGKKIISYKIPGCKDVIMENLNGYLVKLHDQKSVCLKIEMLYRNKNLLKKNSKIAKNFAVNNFGINKVKIVYEKIYSQFKN